MPSNTIALTITGSRIRRELRASHALFVWGLLALALLCIDFTNAHATWNKLPIQFRRAVHCTFFFNEQLGFVGTAGDEGVFKTTDGGLSWQKARIPAGYSGDITQIFMTDTLRGWLSIEEPQNAGNHTFSYQLWKTIDGGLTWTEYGPAGDASCVYQTSLAVISTSRTAAAGLSSLISTDGGVTFQPAPSLALTNGIDFVDDLHGVVTGFQSTKWLYSNDGGRSWQQCNPAISDECWSVYGVKNTSIFYAAGERDPTANLAGTSILRRSVDYGVTWQSSSMPVRTTGHIAGVNEIVYVQTDMDNGTGAMRGLYRTTDQGATWIAVGGPNARRDTRFAVTGCKGGIVYAFDDAGSIWKTRDGGDGTIIEPPPTPVFTPATLNLTSAICSTDAATIVFKNLYCRDMQIVSIGFADSTVGVIAQGGLNIGHEPSTPSTYNQNEGDSIVIRWDPKHAYHHDTTITTKLKIRYYSKAIGRTLDTLIVINATAAGAAPAFVMVPASVAIDTLHACFPRDTAITIANLGCDTLYLNGSTLGAGLTLSTNTGGAITYPVLIAPGGANVFTLHIKPTRAGQLVSQVTLHLVHQGIAKDSSITVRAYVPLDPTLQSLSQLDIGAISTCRTFDTTLVIHNTGCDTLLLNSVALRSIGAYALQNLPALPHAIAPNDSFSVVVRFAPSNVTNYTDSVIVIYTSLGVTLRKAIAVSGIGKLGTSAFRTSLATPDLDFGTRTHCDPPDSLVFKITNPGCVPMHVISVLLTGAVTPGLTAFVSPTMPQSLIDGIAVQVVIRLSTVVRGQFNGQLHVIYQLANQPVVDSIIRVHAEVVHGMRLLSIDTATRTAPRMTFCEVRDTTIIFTNTGCDSLTLTDRSVAGAGWTLLNPRTVPLLLTPGESDTLHVRLVPVAAGAVNGSAILKSNADSASSPTIPLAAFVVPTDSLVFSIRTRQTTYAGDTVIVDVYSGRSVLNQKLTDLSFNLSYDGDVLTPMNGSVNDLPNATMSVGPETRGAGKIATYPIAFHARSTELVIDSTVPMARIFFRATLSDSTWTPVSFTDVLLNHGDPNYAKCTLGSSSVSTPVRVQFLCGDSTIVDAMRFGANLPLTTEPVYPDPVDRGMLKLQFDHSHAGIVTLELVDAHGLRVWSGIRQSTAGRNILTLDVSGFPAGVYRYHLRSDEDRAVKSGAFAIIR